MDENGVASVRKEQHDTKEEKEPDLVGLSKALIILCMVLMVLFFAGVWVSTVEGYKMGISAGRQECSDNRTKAFNHVLGLDEEDDPLAGYNLNFTLVKEGMKG